MYIGRLIGVTSLSAFVRLGAILLLLAAMWTLAPVPTVYAATIVVNTTVDDYGPNPTCSLREAIQAANSDADFGGCTGAGSYGADVITVPAGTFILTGASGEDSNASGDLDITDDVTINGAGLGSTFIQAGTDMTDGVDRVIDIRPSAGTVEINDVTIRYGKAPDGGTDSAGERAGGIYIDDGNTVTLNDCAVNNNTSGNGGDGSAGNWGRQAGLGGGICIDSGSTVTLNACTVNDNVTGDGGDGGSGGGGGQGGDGGGLANYGDLTLNDCTVDGNVTGSGGNGGSGDTNGSEGGRGGGITVGSFATLTLYNSTVSNNTTGDGGDGSGSGSGGDGGQGGGINLGSNATLALTDSTVSGNVTGAGGAGSGTSYRGNGGGLKLDSASATLAGSTISDNGAFHGGGIDTDEDMTLINCTVSGNDAYGSGGGIAASGTAVISLTHTTVANNVADVGLGGGGDGGGIHGSTATVVLMNTILADNTDNSASPVNAPDCYGTMTTLGYNLIEDTTGCTFTAGTGDVTGSDPNLGALADNGGPTWTQALNVGSPAINQIPPGTNGCVSGVSVDQRGAVRADGPGRGGSGCDKGAYEYDSDETPAAVVLQGLAAGSPGPLVLVVGAVAVLGCTGGFVIRRRKRPTL